MNPKTPLHPRHPERTCWGCDKYCPADDLACGNGTVRAMHPIELFGEDWLQWEAARAGRRIDARDRRKPGSFVTLLS